MLRFVVYEEDGKRIAHVWDEDRMFFIKEYGRVVLNLPKETRVYEVILASDVVIVCGDLISAQKARKQEVQP